MIQNTAFLIYRHKETFAEISGGEYLNNQIEPESRIIVLRENIYHFVTVFLPEN